MLQYLINKCYFRDTQVSWNMHANTGFGIRQIKSLFSVSKCFHLNRKPCILSNLYHREHEFALLEFMMQ